MIIIDGLTYDAPFVKVSRSFDVLDKYAERTNDGKLRREIIGVYQNYTIEFGNITDMDEYARILDKLTEPVEFHTITVPDTTGTVTYTAYITGVSDDLRKISGSTNYWRNLKANFISKNPTRTP
jgi:hypothetical protein